MKVLLDYTKNLHFKASARNFRDLNVDEPISFHGTNLGPSAVEYLLIGIGGCLGTTFVFCLRKNKIELESLNVIVDGELSHTGPKMHLRLVNVNVDLNFIPKNDSSDKEIDICMKEFLDHCIITNSITMGLPISVNCTKEKEKK